MAATEAAKNLAKTLCLSSGKEVAEVFDQGTVLLVKLTLKRKRTWRKVKEVLEWFGFQEVKEKEVYSKEYLTESHLVRELEYLTCILVNICDLAVIVWDELEKTKNKK